MLRLCSLMLVSDKTLIFVGLAAAYWFLTKRKQKLTEWYDEKQITDIARGALFTLVLTVFITNIFYFLSSAKVINISTALWYPEYLFLTLLFFSGSTLYLSKRS